jgi:hypothetical protein
MAIYQFSSLYEIFTGANLAYALSDSFNDQLNKKVVGAFSSVEANLTNIESKIEVDIASLVQLKCIKTVDAD